MNDVTSCVPQVMVTKSERGDIYKEMLLKKLNKKFPRKGGKEARLGKGRNQAVMWSHSPEGPQS